MGCCVDCVALFDNCMLLDHDFVPGSCLVQEVAPPGDARASADSAIISAAALEEALAVDAVGSVRHVL